MILFVNSIIGGYAVELYAFYNMLLVASMNFFLIFYIFCQTANGKS